MTSNACLCKQLVFIKICKQRHVIASSQQCLCARLLLSVEVLLCVKICFNLAAWPPSLMLMLMH